MRCVKKKSGLLGFKVLSLGKVSLWTEMITQNLQNKKQQL